IVDQGVDRRLHLAPRAARPSELDALSRLALLSDDSADAFQFVSDRGVRRDDAVERIRDLSFDARPVPWQSDRKIALLHRLKGTEQFGELRRWKGDDGVRRRLGDGPIGPRHGHLRTVNDFWPAYRFATASRGCLSAFDT